MSEKEKTALFARRDHPSGYGYPNGTAHGYSVLLVSYESDDQLEKIKIALKDFQGRSAKLYEGGHLGSWYGGCFDFLATLDTTDIDLGNNNDFNSLGDNRFVGRFSGEEILELTKNKKA